MGDPLVSLVVPVHDGEAHLPRLFAMLGEQLDQELRRVVEVVLVDDASTDRSPALIARFGGDHAEWVQSINLDQNSGVGVARRTALEVARGTFLMWLDVDDELHEGALARVVEAARASDGETILVFDFRYRLADGSTRPGRGMEAASTDGFAAAAGQLLRREVSPYFWNKVVPRRGLVPEHFATRRNGQDWLSMVSFLSVHPRLERVPYTLVDYVQQQGTLSRKTDLLDYTSIRDGLAGQMRTLLQEHSVWEECRDDFERWYAPRISANSALASARRDHRGPGDSLPAVRANIFGLISLSSLLKAVRRGDRVAAAALLPLWVSPRLFRWIARR
ncbi:MAG: glycosyltransferase [Acidimicrobiales bacterium]|nr:glycosyltransferase [Acidimicrobiales bacterium]